MTPLSTSLRKSRVYVEVSGITGTPNSDITTLTSFDDELPTALSAFEEESDDLSPSTVMIKTEEPFPPRIKETLTLAVDLDKTLFNKNVENHQSLDQQQSLVTNEEPEVLNLKQILHQRRIELKKLFLENVKDDQANEDDSPTISKLMAGFVDQAKDRNVNVNVKQQQQRATMTKDSSLELHKIRLEIELARLELEARPLFNEKSLVWGPRREKILLPQASEASIESETENMRELESLIQAVESEISQYNNVDIGTSHNVGVDKLQKDKCCAGSTSLDSSDYCFLLVEELAEMHVAQIDHRYTANGTQVIHVTLDLSEIHYLHVSIETCRQERAGRIVNAYFIGEEDSNGLYLPPLDDLLPGAMKNQKHRNRKPAGLGLGELVRQASVRLQTYKDRKADLEALREQYKIHVLQDPANTRDLHFQRVVCSILWDYQEVTVVFVMTLDCPNVPGSVFLESLSCPKLCLIQLESYLQSQQGNFSSPLQLVKTIQDLLPPPSQQATPSPMAQMCFQ